MKIVTVIPLSKGLRKDDLSYFSGKEVEKGDVVEIPLRGKSALGLVISADEAVLKKSSVKNMSFNLKKVSKVKGRSIWRKEYFETIASIAQYSAGSKGSVAQALIPETFRDSYDHISKAVPKNESKVAEKNIRSEKLLFQAPLEERLSLYKNLVRSSFAEKKSFFIALPTEKDISIFRESLAKGIENFTFVLHSGFSKKKIMEDYEKIAGTDHPVLILATVPFLSIPVNNIGTIAIERESSAAYKMISRPYVDLRVFAETYASRIRARFILGDSLLRFESFAKKGSPGWSDLEPLAWRKDWHGRIIVTGKYEDEKFRILSEKSKDMIEEALNARKNVFIFSLRKGLATYTVCHDCGECILCERCMTPVTLYASRSGSKRMFSCNRCHAEKDPEMTCPSCGSWNLVPLGVGTDTIAEEVRKIFPKARIFKLDKESAKTSRGAEKIIEDFEAAEGSVLIGTELALPYLSQKLPLSVMASFDSLWSIPSFRMSEKIARLIMNMIEKTSESICIETRNENDPGICAIKDDSLLHFARNELSERSSFGYPPYKRFIKITLSGTKEAALKAKSLLRDVFSDYDPDIYGGFVPKVKDKYITNALLRVDPMSWSLPETQIGGSIDARLLSRLSSLPPQYAVNVDPEDLL